MLQRQENGTLSFGKIELLIQALIALNLIAFTIETLPDLSKTTRSVLQIFEVASILIFTVEYLMRLCLTRPWHRYAYSFFGIIDLLAILPFYIMVGLDLRSMRIFRLLRLIRILKLTKYSSALQRMRRAFYIAREEIILSSLISAIVLYLAAGGIYFFEHKAQPENFSSIFESFWWAICTLTTVGYGDVYPITTGGRIFTSFILIIGIGIVAIPTGLFASALLHARNHKGEDSNRA